MKKINLVGLTFLLPIIISTGAFASQIHIGNNYNFNQRYIIASSDCVTEYLTKLDQKAAIVKSCYLSQPLVKGTKAHSYPNLRGNPRLVDYWAGAYSKDILYTATILRELVNTCGPKPNIISSRQFVVKNLITSTFELDNLNLHDDITEDIMTLGMLPAEAAKALDQAQLDCLAP